MEYLFAAVLIAGAMVYRWLRRTKAWEDPMVDSSDWAMAQLIMLSEKKQDLREWRKRHGLL